MDGSLHQIYRKRKHERERAVQQTTKIICYLFGGSEAKGTGDSEAQRNDWSWRSCQEVQRRLEAQRNDEPNGGGGRRRLE
jgi:hypothetical protein